MQKRTTSRLRVEILQVQVATINARLQLPSTNITSTWMTNPQRARQFDEGCDTNTIPKYAAERYSFEFAGEGDVSVEWILTRHCTISIDQKMSIDFDCRKVGEVSFDDALTRRRPRSVLRVFHTSTYTPSSSIHTNTRIRKHSNRQQVQDKDLQDATTRNLPSILTLTRSMDTKWLRSCSYMLVVLV